MRNKNYILSKKLDFKANDKKKN